MATDNTAAAPGEPDANAADWAAAVDSRSETASELQGPADQVSPAAFTNFQPTPGGMAGNDINMILDIPVQLTVELGRARIPIKNILQLAQGSVVELEALAGEPMDVLVNGYLIAQGEVVVVNDKFGIRLTDIVTPSERMRRLLAPVEPASEMSNGLSSLLWFIAILALIPATLWFLKRTPLGGGGSGVMKSIASLPLSTSQRIVTIEVGTGEERRWLVLGITPASITTLHTMAAQAVEAAPTSRPAKSIRPSPRSSAASAATATEPTAMPAERIALAAQRRENEELNEHFRRRGSNPKRLAWLGLLVLVAVTLVVVALPAAAQSTSPGGEAGLPLLIGQSAGSTSYSVPVQTLLFFTALSFLPAVLLLMTSFTRIVIVLSLLRQALGTQAAPPNQVVVGLSLFLTFFVMGPTIDKVYADAYQPYATNKIAFEEALKRGESPVRDFMMKQTRQADVMLFAKLARIDPAVKTADVPFKVLVPAFVTSELKSAFQIGFLVFLPFLIIDMIVASVLMSLGMMMLSPVLIALPFKLMLFVLADGWNLLLGSLAASFVT